MRELSIEQMTDQHHRGNATALLPDGPPGPMHYRGRWWSIPRGGHAYRPVAPHDAATFDDHARRLARIAPENQDGAR